MELRVYLDVDPMQRVTVSREELIALVERIFDATLQAEKFIATSERESPCLELRFVTRHAWSQMASRAGK